MMTVLVSDKLSKSAIKVFADRGVKVDFAPELGRDEEKLLSIIDQYDGLAVRSATRVNKEVIKRGKKLKIIGRAGIGVDNIDIHEASRHGIIVMNTPFGNSITTGEHAIALMFSLARRIPQANASTHAGKWEKSRFMGTEITGKTLGIIGCGNIGSIVAKRAAGLQMHVVAYDPFLSAERAVDLGVKKVELDELFTCSDFISLHTPLTDKTCGIIDARAISLMKDGVKIINCARGGLIIEQDLAAAIKSGKVAGAAIDVFASEPAIENPLFGMQEVICTPHLGASTMEAQENVAIQIAEQMTDYLLTGDIKNAINVPSITSEEENKLRPFIKLAEILGSFIGQIVEDPIKEVEIIFDGTFAKMNTKILGSSVLTGLMRPQLAEVNMVSAPVMLKERGVRFSEIKQDKSGVFDGYIKLIVKTDKNSYSVAGSCFSDLKPRFIQINGINLESEVGRYMLYATNMDMPGIISILGTSLGDHNVNIANFALGRTEPGGSAGSLLYLDAPLPRTVLDKIKSFPEILAANPLEFAIE